MSVVEPFQDGDDFVQNRDITDQILGCQNHPMRHAWQEVHLRVLVSGHLTHAHHVAGTVRGNADDIKPSCSPGL